MSNLRYEATHQPPEEFPLKLLYITSSKYEGDWHSTPHAHQCTELFYVVSGRGEFRVEEIFFPVAENHLVVINPNVQHTETAVAQSPLEYIVLGIEGGEFLLKDWPDSRYCSIHCGEGDNEILWYINKILRELEARQEYAGAVAHYLLGILAVKLLRSVSLSVTAGTPKKANLECAHVKRYIDNHYKENITLDTLAEIAHLNKYYLAHNFTREYGISPINYLIARRIKESQYFLAQTNYSISEISRILGFSSPSYFSQSFVKAQKITPRQYRQQAKQGPAQ